MSRPLFFLLYCAAFLVTNAAVAAEQLVPRTIIALYDNRGGGIATSYIHMLAEMPLNQLGLTVEYYDIHQPLPDITDRKDVRGVLTWFFSDTALDGSRYFAWANQAVDVGKKYVVIGPMGVAQDGKHFASIALAHKFMSRIGVRLLDGWVQNPFDVTYTYETPELFLAAAPYQWLRPPYRKVLAIGDAKAHLIVRRDGSSEDDSNLIITGANGGYAAAEYLFRTNEHNDNDVNQWLIDPFEFFRLAFATDDLPKPDVTTIAGRRLYYSHIDGDGWNNVTQVEEYKEKPVLSAQVVMEKAIKAYPDLPVTLTIIAGDIDPKWAAVDESRDVAKAFYALPNVEAGTHTYSHPFYWQFFKDYQPRKEIPYLSAYPNPTWQPQQSAASVANDTSPIPSGYRVPRAYAYEPFDLHKEIEGSIAELSALLPPDKKLAVLTWSGNCSPWEEAVHLTRMAGLQNLNGGDSRFDPEYPAFASLAPIGRVVGKERQIYASSSNENTYTDLWSKNFHAYRYLQKTLENSETPIRLKPFNIYYHIYAGERDASLNALRANLDFARTQDIAPVKASQYTKIAESFYDTQIVQLSPTSWRIDKRGALETIRFDHSVLQSVDFARSKGVIGQRHFQGSLYVYLDAAVIQPIITLKADDQSFAPAEEPQAYLVESRWPISNLHRQDNRFDFVAQGFGPGEMVWQVPSPGQYVLAVDGKPGGVVATDTRLLKFTIKRDALKPLHITIKPAGDGESHA